jgi:hypothetical protein
VDFLSVDAVIGVARHTALGVTDKRGSSEIALFDEERITTSRQVLIHVPTHLCPQFTVLQIDGLNVVTGTPLILASVILILGFGAFCCLKRGPEALSMRARRFLWYSKPYIAFG